MKRIKGIAISLLLFSGIFATVVNASDFESVASSVITKIVRSQPSKSSVKKIYKVNHNRPIWVTGSGLSSLGQGLLDRSSKCHI